MNKRVKIHVPEPITGLGIVQPLWHRFPESGGSVVFDKDLPQSFFEKSVEFADLQEAEYILLPNAFLGRAQEDGYIKKYADWGEKLGIPVLIFCLGDLTDQIRFDPRVYVFRQSLYRSVVGPEDIVMPTLTEDLGKMGILPRSKIKTPAVSFCGQGGYNTIDRQIKYYLKVLLWKLRSVFKPILRARIVGVYWRRKMMRACERSGLVKTIFIVRKSFSGAYRTIELDPARARKEFIDSIVNSDFVLAPKGDGNYSNRFLEALSLGRIPVLLDTDTVLPLEEEVDYSRVVVRVPMDKVKETPRYIRAWYDALTESEWLQRQHEARELYINRLRIDSFFEYFFTTVAPRLPQTPQKIQGLVPARQK